MKILYTLFLPLVLFSCQGVSQEQQVSKVLAPTEFKVNYEAAENAYLIDVRTPQEFNAGHIEGAVNYNLIDGTLEKSLKALDKDREVYVYCAVGGRSAKAAKLLLANGFTKVTDLKGGYNAWSKK